MTPQPYAYRRRPLVEPDWTRLPAWRTVSEAQWRDAQWQRAHCVKNVGQLREVYGDLLPDAVYDDLARDQAEHATMSVLLPPHMVNTVVPGAVPDEESFRADPVRRYMLPLASDRDPDFPSHPYATRDSLHEQEMWAVEGLTHRYPTKVLAELLATCPQYCGHCTRMDLVGNPVSQVAKHRFETKHFDRHDAMLAHIAATPSIRDVVVSGGDVANLPPHRLVAFLERLLAVEHVRDVRLATKGLMGLPQHWLQPRVLDGIARVAGIARSRGVSLAVHTHVNSAQSVTPLVAEAARALLDAGVRDVRNQGVLLRGVNDTQQQLLDLCFALLDEASVTPYYFYLCDMVPGSEHWRTPVWQAQELQHAIMGYLPGFATPRVVCDVPYVGKRWVHQLDAYDRVLGVSEWTKNYRTSVESDDADALRRRYPYYDPVHSLPEEGRAWWAAHARDGAATAAAQASRAAAAALVPA